MDIEITVLCSLLCGRMHFAFMKEVHSTNLSSLIYCDYNQQQLHQHDSLQVNMSQSVSCRQAAVYRLHLKIPNVNYMSRGDG